MADSGPLKLQEATSSIPTPEVVRLEPKEVSEVTSPIVIHPTQQHMKAYSLSEDQLDFLGGAQSIYDLEQCVRRIYFCGHLNFPIGLNASRPADLNTGSVV